MEKAQWSALSPLPTGKISQEGRVFIHSPAFLDIREDLEKLTRSLSLGAANAICCCSERERGGTWHGRGETRRDERIGFKTRADSARRFGFLRCQIFALAGHELLVRSDVARFVLLIFVADDTARMHAARRRLR